MSRSEDLSQSWSTPQVGSVDFGFSGIRSARGQIKIDLLAQSEEGQPILLVEIKAREGRPEDVEQLRSYLQVAGKFPFAMLVDLSRIQIFKWDGQRLEGPIRQLETKAILGSYSDYFNKPHLTDFYIVTLVEVWLRDLGYHWKFTDPPAAKEMTDVGLLPLLENADTFTEVTAGGYLVP